MNDKYLLELVKKKEDDLTGEDKEFLRNLSATDKINDIVFFNPNFIKYMNIKSQDISVADEILRFVSVSIFYENLRVLDEFKSLNIKNVYEFKLAIFNQNEEFFGLFKKVQDKIDLFLFEQEINRQVSVICNSLIDYLNDKTIAHFIMDGIKLPSILNDRNRIERYIENDFPMIIDYIDIGLLSKDLIEKALDNDYVLTDRSPEIIKTNPDYIRVLIQKGQKSAIDYVPENVLEANEDLIYLAIDNGYHISYPSSSLKTGLIIHHPSMSPEILRTSPKYMRYLIEHGIPEIINYASEEVLENNIDLLHLAKENGYSYGFYNRGFAMKLFLRQYIKNQQFDPDEIVNFNFKDSEISKLFDDYETAYGFIKILEMKKSDKKDVILFFLHENGFSELGYQNLISSIIDFGDLLLLKKIYKLDKYKDSVYKQKNKLMQIYPNNIRTNTNIDEFFNLNDEDIVEKINVEKLNSNIAKFVALNLSYYGSESDKIYEILRNKEFRDQFAFTLLDSRPVAIDFLIKHIKYDDNEFKDKLVFYSIDLGYKIIKYNPDYLKQYKFIKYSIEKGLTQSLDCISENTLTKNQVIELFLLARSKGYVFGKESWYVVDNIIDNKEIMDTLFSTLSCDEIGRIFGIDFFARKIPGEQFDIYLNYFLECDIDLSIFLTATSFDRFVENDELLSILLEKKPIEQISIIGRTMLFRSSYSKFQSKLSSEQLKCIGYYNKYSFMVKYFDGKTLEQVYNDYIKDDIIWHIAFKEVNWELLDISKLNEKELFCIEIYNHINDSKLREEFKSYLLNNFDGLDKEKTKEIANIFNKLAVTNSKSLFSIRLSLVQQLQLLDNPVESYDQIEKVFIRNNIPLYAKMYFCFKILYPNLTNKYGNMRFDDLSRMSPELKDSSLPKTNIRAFMNNPTNNDVRLYIIYNDLLRNAVKSNSKDLRKYLDNIELGDYLYRKIIGEKISNEIFDSMSDMDKNEALEIFISHLETIYKYTAFGKYDKNDLSKYDLIEKIKYLKENFRVTQKYDLKDRIVRSFGYSAGYTSFEQIRNEMRNAVLEANERGMMFAQQLEEKPFEFADGDFLRCIGDYYSFSGSIENGNFSKEFLTIFRDINDSDTTPLDIDFTLIRKRQSLYHCIADTPTGFGFGNVFLVLKKDNPNLNITRDENGNLINVEYDPKKIEMFGTKVDGTGGYETHWGVRTGMSMTDVDYILFKEDRVIDKEKPYNEDGTINYTGEPLQYDDLSKIKFEIARHGYYIPIIDFTGKLIFSLNEFNVLREKMSGLSYYDMGLYKFFDNLELDGIEQIMQYLDKSNKKIKIKRKKIDNILVSIFQQYDLKLKDKMDGDLTSGTVEVLDTGSTGRKTNKLWDGDFDLLIRIDQQLARNVDKYNELKDSIRQGIEQYPYESCGVTDSGDYRFKKVQIDEETLVDIDLSFTIKTDKMTYSTDECLKDRLKTIEKQDSLKYKKVVSNIIIAKEVLKRAECYKPSRSDINQGGLGGAGIENWILQHGGSFIDAAQDFLSVADKCESFIEFKKKYFIWDFGENHFAERKGHYSHDNFIDNMNQTGFEKMKKCLRQFLISYSQNDVFNTEGIEINSKSSSK